MGISSTLKKGGDMDPNACLEDILRLTQKIGEDYRNPDSKGIDQEDALELAESISILHNWIKNGGFLPKEWKGVAT